MIYMEFQHVRAAVARLLEHVSGLKDIRNELEQSLQVIRRMSFTEETCRLLTECLKETEEEIRFFKQAADCLEQACESYCRTEQQIADTYNLEIIDEPNMKIAVNTFANLESKRDMIKFRGW